MSHAEMSTRAPLMERLLKTFETPGAATWLTRWSVLAIGAIALAGIMALLLAFSRIPGIQDVFPWPLDFFKKGLVVHVVFSFVVFFLCMFAGVAHIAATRLANGTPNLSWMEFAAYRGTVVAFVFLFVPALMQSGEPTFSNYIPVITDRLFYAALVVLAVSMALMAILVLANLPNRPKEHGFGMDMLTLSGVAGSVFYLVALAYGLIAWSRLNGQPVDLQFNEELFWAAGHALQFVNVAVLLGAWYAIGAAATGRIPFNPMSVVAGIAVLGVGIVISAGIFAGYEMFSADWRLGFTNLQYVFAPATLIAAVCMVRSLLKMDDKPWDQPGFLAMVLSPIVFGIGGVMGLFVDGLDTRTPGHYHGMIAGVTLAFMGLMYQVFLPLTGKAVKSLKTARVTIYLFAFGQTVAAIGLFIAGGHGTQRKVAGADQGLSALGAKIGMGLNGGGGLLAVIGGAMFVWVVGRALFSKAREN